MGFEVSGLETMITALDNAEASTDETMDAMLDAQADIVVEAQKKTADTMLQGPYNKGAVKDAITKGKIKQTKNGREIRITFEGMQHGERISTIAFINEYGKTNQPARPFVRTANEQSEGAALVKAVTVYDQSLKQNGL